MNLRLWVLLAAVVAARAQGISPTGEREKARFDAVTRAAARAGYAGPMVVALAPEPVGALFALLASHNGQGVLLAVVEPGGVPLEIESDKTPADIGVRGVRFEAFLGAPDLVDVVVGHRPFRLEQSYEFERHHILRRRGEALATACDFDGGSNSGYAKGMRSVTSTNTVTVVRVAASAALAFEVKIVSETTESAGTGPATVSDRSEKTTRYQMTAGRCLASPQ